jgi:hypothetical protein
MDFVEFSNEQRRQLIDAQQAYSVWRSGCLELDKIGTLRLQSSKGNRYVYEVHGRVRKSLGRETPDLIARKAKHDAKVEALKNSTKSLRKRLDQMAPVNRALGLGRIPTIAARILRELDREELLGPHIIVAGTNALFAYEAATGTILRPEHVATMDADLLWDIRQSLQLAATGIRPEGIMGILRRVDRSFVTDYGYNATNAEGYIVDLLCPETDGATTMNAGCDLEATPMAGAEWLIVPPKFEQTIIGEDGWPLRIVVPEPRTFALHKLWLSERDDRNPLKRPRDAAQARLVAELARVYLRKPMKATEMPWLSKELRVKIKEFKKV